MGKKLEEINKMPGKMFSELMDALIEKNPEANVNDMFDALDIKESRSDFAFGCILKQIRDYHNALRDFNVCRGSRAYRTLIEHFGG